MIYKDPLANREVKEGRWFAWYPVQLNYENKTAWLTHIYRKFYGGGNGGVWVYASKKELL
jgi:hypothetical protein